MPSIKELLELRKQIKSKKPNFTRQDAHKKKKLGKKWKRPKGLQSKIRLKLRGRGKRVSIGYRGPKKVRHMHKSGMQKSIVHSVKDLEGLDSKKNGVVISSSVGNKKKIVILKKAKKKGFNILNFNNPEEFIKKIEDKMDLKKKLKEEKKKKVEKKESKEEKKEKPDEKVVDEKEDVEKKEKNKMLTKRA
jgi:large subunit ribosomal protein L32e